jgi:hypothetical protein
VPKISEPSFFRAKCAHFLLVIKRYKLFIKSQVLQQLKNLI